MSRSIDSTRGTPIEMNRPVTVNGEIRSAKTSSCGMTGSMQAVLCQAHIFSSRDSTRSPMATVGDT